MKDIMRTAALVAAMGMPDFPEIHPWVISSNPTNPKKRNSRAKVKAARKQRKVKK